MNYDIPEEKFTIPKDESSIVYEVSCKNNKGKGTDPFEVDGFVVDESQSRSCLGQ